MCIGIQWKYRTRTCACTACRTIQTLYGLRRSTEVCSYCSWGKSQTLCIKKLHHFLWLKQKTGAIRKQRVLMYNIIHISCSTSQYCSIFKHLGQGSTGFERKSRRQVCSVTNLLQQSPPTVLKHRNMDPKVHPTTQAVVHSGAKLQPWHSSTTAFPPVPHLLHTSPSTQELHF